MTDFLYFLNIFALAVFLHFVLVKMAVFQFCALEIYIQQKSVANTVKSWATSCMIKVENLLVMHLANSAVLKLTMVKRKAIR